MPFAIIAVFAVKLQCVLCVSKNTADEYKGRCGRLVASRISEFRLSTQHCISEVGLGAEATNDYVDRW